MGFRGVPHLLALVALLPFAAAAAVIDVPGDQPSIAAGIAMASNGDTVQVAPGTWAGVDNVNLNLAGKAIAVLGAGPGQTVIDCGGTPVRGNVVNVEPDADHVSLGMPVRLTTFGIGEDSEGTEAVGFGYEPIDPAEVA